MSNGMIAPTYQSGKRSMPASNSATILTHAEYQLGSLHDALGC